MNSASKIRRYISIIVQRDATKNSLFIILRVHSTCFGCQPHPTSGVHKTVTTASGIGHIFCAATVHRWSILIIVQRDATKSSIFIILQLHSTCFGCQPHPSSGVHKTVTTATSLQRSQASLATLEWKEVASQKKWPVPEAVVTVLCTPDAGCGWHPKHVEWTCRKINRLLRVASLWTVINIDMRCTEP